MLHACGMEPCLPMEPSFHPAPCPRFDPLWNSLVVGGLHEGRPFLGTVGMIGTNYTDAHVATGACCCLRGLGWAHF